jgi:hypothetical protein
MCEYALSFPATLKLSMPAGQSCAMGACNRIEQVELTDAGGGMTLAIQRNINPGQLPLRAGLAGRSQPDATETLTTLRGTRNYPPPGSRPFETVRYSDGKAVNRISRVVPERSILRRA